MGKTIICICFSLTCILACNNKDISETKSNYRAFFDTLNYTPYPARKALIDRLGLLYHKKKSFSFYDNIERMRIYRDHYLYSVIDFVMAKKYNDSIIQELKDKVKYEYYAQKYVVALYLQGDMYLAMDIIDKSLLQYSMATDFANRYVKDTCKVKPFAERTARLYFLLNRHRLATTKYREFLENFMLCNDYQENTFYALAEGFQTISESFLELEMLDSARFYTDSALRFFDKYETYYKNPKPFIERNRFYCYGIKAEILHKENRLYESDSLYRKTLTDIPMISEDSLYVQRIILNYADLLLARRNFFQADSMLNVFNIMRKYYPDKRRSFQYVQLKLRMCELLGGKGCDEYKVLHTAMTAEINEKNERYNNMDFRTMFDLQISKMRNRSLKDENDLKNSYLIISLLLIILCFIIIFLAYWSYKRSRNFANELYKVNEIIVNKNDQLQSAYVSIQQSQIETDRLSKILAHDLQSQINGIKMLASLSQTQINAASTKEMLRVIENTCADSLLAIKAVLKDSEKNARQTPEKINLKNVLDSCVGLMQLNANEKGQKISIEAKDVFTIVYRQEISRVINNLLSNAIKFSHANENIVTGISRKNGFALIFVRDFGIGIPKYLQSYVFDSPEKVSRNGTIGEVSHGLGLSIAKQIVDNNQGKLWFESVENEGSVFYIQLPIV